MLSREAMDACDRIDSGEWSPGSTRPWRGTSQSSGGALARPLTLADKVLLGHLDDPGAPGARARAGATCSLRPDRVVLPGRARADRRCCSSCRRGATRVAVPTTIHCDHLIQARVEGDAGPARVARGERRGLRLPALGGREVRRGLLGARAPGIIHQVVLENYAFPGALIIGTDSHTPNAGGLGACAVGVGGADAVEVDRRAALGSCCYPRRIAVYLTGELGGWTAPKDVILYVAGQLTASRAARTRSSSTSAPARARSARPARPRSPTWAPSSARPRRCSPPTSAWPTYLRATGRGELVPLVERHRALLAPDPEVEARSRASTTTAWSSSTSRRSSRTSSARTRPIARARSRSSPPRCATRGNGFVDEISAALIGSCTNSSYEDMSRAADVAGRRARTASRRRRRSWSRRARSRCARPSSATARWQSLREIGGDRARERLRSVHRPVAPAAGRARTRPNTIVTSYNRNFPGPQRRPARRR